MQTYKVVVQIEGVKRKQQISKKHDIVLSNSRYLPSIEELKDLAANMMTSNMRTVNTATLLCFKTIVKHDVIEKVETTPSISIKLLNK